MLARTISRCGGGQLAAARAASTASIAPTREGTGEGDVERRTGEARKAEAVDAKEEWRRRSALRTPVLQRDEVVPAKVYFAPEWPLDQKASDDEGWPNPMKGYGVTPEKWEHYNKVVWPPGYIVPETGLPKPREVFHCRQSIHFSPKRAWYACQLVWRMNVDEALVQLDLQQTKATGMLAEVLREAKARATDEFHIDQASRMHVAEAFPIQSNIIKGARRHAHEDWHEIRYRYIHLYVRLEEGEGPGYKGRVKPRDGWDKMEEYYKYLRSRQIKHSIG
ncbi:mrpl-22 [Pristionchus pacificus]|uniref:Large ribosomal subunit protein uL22m n=1 Tax=Pristionchus pacificus TaxID=54126 RepID=A0A2A6CDW7_PRIPA|nr:mrpl-22 [Pristionchus pacificus]|eukprot:PDM76435.1 mrpl-22 [Pristionchus pacificus]